MLLSEELNGAAFYIQTCEISSHVVAQQILYHFVYRETSPAPSTRTLLKKSSHKQMHHVLCDWSEVHGHVCLHGKALKQQWRHCI